MRKTNEGLRAVKKDPNDEYYTLAEDVQQELRWYEQCFKGMKVYCNADNRHRSEFAKFFEANFERYALNELIASEYVPNGHGMMWRFDGTVWEETELNGDGSWDSYECLGEVNANTAVVTNPPFSQIKHLLPTVEALGAKIVLLGPKTAIGYKEIAPLISNGKVFMGANQGARKFEVPPEHPKGKKEPDGAYYATAPNLWFTNVEHEQRRREYPLAFRYSPDDYPKYDNMDAIHVGKSAHIPKDYEGEMSVPISFLSHLNPDQFELVGTARQVQRERLGKNADPKLNGEEVFARLIIKHRQKEAT